MKRISVVDVDFERLIPERPKPPQTPPCQKMQKSYAWTDKNKEKEPSACGRKSVYRIGGKYYCAQHAGVAALDYIKNLKL